MAKNVIINRVTYADVPAVDIPQAGGGMAWYYDDSDATAGSDDVLSGKTYYKGGKQTGTMADNGDTSGDISTKAGTVEIPAGYTSGGSVGIASAEQAKLIASNIKSGVTLLGQAGSPMVLDTTISSDAASASHIISGKKAYVNGALVTGDASMPTVSQDSVTKVLTIQ